MTRTITPNQYGGFDVSDDPQGAIAVALSVAVNPDNVRLADVELSPRGDGLHVQAFGGIYRAMSRDDLFPPFDQDPSFDPETQELWVLFREPDHTRSVPGRFVIHGDELRELVARARALRGR